MKNSRGERPPVWAGRGRVRAAEGADTLPGTQWCLCALVKQNENQPEGMRPLGPSSYKQVRKSMAYCFTLSENTTIDFSPNGFH